MKKIEVEIKLIFHQNGEESVEIETKGVPKTLIVEQLNALTGLLARQIVDDAKFVPNSDKEDHVNARIEIDRQRLKQMFNS